MEPLDLPPESSLELDIPKEGEREWETLFGAGNLEPSGYNVFYPPSIFNQGAKPKTRMACSRYGAIHAINAQNKAVAERDGMRTYEYNPEVMWQNYLKVNPAAEKEGATLQSSLDQMVELSLITGYSRIRSQDDMKASLLAFKPILTGSQNGDWSYVRDYKSYRLREDGRIVGHIFCIVGFDGAGWIAINSYGASNGVFHIPYELTDSLFSRYAMSDTRDAHLFA